MMMTLHAQDEALIAAPSNMTTEFASQVASTSSDMSRSPSGIYESDVLLRLKSNLEQLQDLHARLQFVMGEISYLIKKP